MTTQRFRIALVFYAVLAGVGSVSTSGDVRIVLWIFFGGLALKSYIAWIKHRLGD